MRGRKSKPAAVKIAQGNPGKRKIVENKRVKAVDPRLSRFSPPDWLVDEVALKVWSDTADDLVKLNFLRPSDRHSFARYCAHLSKWVAASKIIDTEGDHYETKSVTGELLKRLNPMVKVREIAEKHLIELEDRFGLNPTARQKMLRGQAALPAAGLFDGMIKKEDGESDDLPHSRPLGSPIGVLTAARLN
jgi:P27 family predicted phage terminase small subunit